MMDDCFIQFIVFVYKPKCPFHNKLQGIEGDAVFELNHTSTSAVVWLLPSSVYLSSSQLFHYFLLSVHLVIFSPFFSLLGSTKIKRRRTRVGSSLPSLVW